MKITIKMISTFIMILFLTILFVNLVPSHCYSQERTSSIGKKGRVINFPYSDIRDSGDEDKVMNYSGKTVIWEGELVRKIANDAYFEYILKLDTGDKVRVLSVIK